MMIMLVVVFLNVPSPEELASRSDLFLSFIELDASILALLLLCRERNSTMSPRLQLRANVAIIS